MTTPCEPRDRAAVDADFGRRLRTFDLPTLRALHGVFQRRLGTPAQYLGDCERARMLGDEINLRLAPDPFRTGRRPLAGPASVPGRPTP